MFAKENTWTILNIYSSFALLLFILNELSPEQHNKAFQRFTKVMSNTQRLPRWGAAEPDWLGRAAASGVALKPSCVSRAAVRALNRYLKPRTIHIVSGTRAQCAVFEVRATCLLAAPGLLQGD